MNWPVWVKSERKHISSIREHQVIVRGDPGLPKVAGLGKIELFMLGRVHAKRLNLEI
jgi:hypothetical protein